MYVDVDVDVDDDGGGGGEENCVILKLNSLVYNFLSLDLHVPFPQKTILGCSCGLVALFDVILNL